MDFQITDKELAVIKEISQNSTIDQRTIAKSTGLSLGITNLIIKKLIKVGYIKVKQLNKKKVEYILTPKGFLEKTKKTYNYILKTANQFLSIYKKLENLILKQYNTGKTKFYILATDEIYQIIVLAFNTLKLKNITYKRIRELPKNLQNTNTIYIVMLDKNNFQDKPQVINILDYLS